MAYSTLGANMIRNAEVFATAAHAAVKQKRNYTGEPYIVHPRAVAETVQVSRHHTWKHVVLAWIHDTVEDTGVTRQVIEDVFGKEIDHALYYLTNVEVTAGNRAQRHQMNVARLAKAPAWVKTVKVADIYDNTKDIAKVAPAFAPQYLQEKQHAMLALRDCDDPVLWGLVHERIVKQQMELLNAA